MKKLKKIIKTTIIIIVLLVGYFVYSGYSMYKNALDKASIDKMISTIKLKDNYTKIEDISETYKNAVVATEDHRFYKHNGIDLTSILRAFVTDIKSLSFKEGGSTITQQLSKNMYFTQDKKIERKIAEIFMARDIEKKYSKNEILEFYLNTSYYGNGYYSIKEATIGYFNKIPKDISDKEAISLAGIFSAPTYYNPNYNAEINNKRRKVVISKMIKYGYLKNSETKEILNN